MKTIKEKAKRYDEILEKARSWYIDAQLSFKKSLEALIPELKESSENEKIKNFISNELACLRAADEKGTVRYNELTDAIAWLEKQGEYAKFRDSIQVGDKITKNQDGIFVNLSQLERVANKTKPKFEIGDWIIDSCGVTLHIINVEDGYYVVENPYVKVFNFDRASADLSCYPWTIRYAEPGDVLVAENGWTCIFRKVEYQTFHSYCFMDSAHNFYPEGGSGHTLDDRICGKMSPATKEQRNLFFSKMKEAGYEWDSKHFKLKSIK